jgi:hypothetical protein
MHFEQLWEQVEESSGSVDDSSAWRELKSIVDDWEVDSYRSGRTQEEKDTIVGRILLLTSVLSREYGINVFQSLQTAIDEHLINEDKE